MIVIFIYLDDILESVEFVPAEDPSVIAKKGQVLPAIEATQMKEINIKINTKINYPSNVL